MSSNFPGRGSGNSTQTSGAWRNITSSSWRASDEKRGTSDGPGLDTSGANPVSRGVTRSIQAPVSSVSPQRNVQAPSSQRSTQPVFHDRSPQRDRMQEDNDQDREELENVNVENEEDNGEMRRKKKLLQVCKCLIYM